MEHCARTSPGPAGSRNGYRQRERGTRDGLGGAGDPGTQAGLCFPSLLEHRRRVKRACRRPAGRGPPGCHRAFSTALTEQDDERTESRAVTSAGNTRHLPKSAEGKRGLLVMQDRQLNRFLTK
jgi:hypothetical protein